MPVDQTNSEAIAAVITELRQRVLDAGPPYVTDTPLNPIDSAALRLAALCLFDIGLALTQDQTGPAQEAAVIATLEDLVGRECPHCHNGLRLDFTRSLDPEYVGFWHIDEDGMAVQCSASAVAIRMLLTAQGHAIPSDERVVDSASRIIRRMLESARGYDDEICFWCQNKLDDQTQHEDDCVGEAAWRWLEHHGELDESAEVKHWKEIADGVRDHLQAMYEESEQNEKRADAAEAELHIEQQLHIDTRAKLAATEARAKEAERDAGLADVECHRLVIEEVDPERRRRRAAEARAEELEKENLVLEWDVQCAHEAAEWLAAKALYREAERDAAEARAEEWEAKATLYAASLDKGGWDDLARDLREKLAAAEARAESLLRLCDNKCVALDKTAAQRDRLAEALRALWDEDAFGPHPALADIPEPTICPHGRPVGHLCPHCARVVNDTTEPEVPRPDHAAFSCSFCGKSEAEVGYLITGPCVFICTECLDICNDIVAEKMGVLADTPEPKES